MIVANGTRSKKLDNFEYSRVVNETHPSDDEKNVSDDEKNKTEAKKQASKHKEKVTNDGESTKRKLDFFNIKTEAKKQASELKEKVTNGEESTKRKLDRFIDITVEAKKNEKKVKFEKKSLCEDKLIETISQQEKRVRKKIRLEDLVCPNCKHKCNVYVSKKSISRGHSFFCCMNNRCHRKFLTWLVDAEDLIISHNVLCNKCKSACYIRRKFSNGFNQRSPKYFSCPSNECGNNFVQWVEESL